MEGRCATCKWWRAPRPPVLWGECQQITEVVDMNNPYTKDMQPAMLPCGCEEFDSLLYTTKDFGCVLYEPKEPT